MADMIEDVDKSREKRDADTRIDSTAHKGAQRLFVAGLSVGAIYWGAVIRWSESCFAFRMIW